MMNEYNKLTNQSWHDIYTIYFETNVIPATWPQEAIMCLLHYVSFLPKQDTLHLFSEMMGLRLVSDEEK